MRLASFFVLAFVVLFVGDYNYSLIADNSIDKKSLTEFIKSSNNFSLSFASFLFESKKENENLFISPYSLYEAFGMLYFGSNGSTKEELKKTFRFYIEEEKLKISFKQLRNKLQVKDKETIFATANKIWPDSSIVLKKKYVDDLNDYFSSDIQTLNYSKSETAKRIINDWVASQTYDKIKDLIPSLDPSTLLVLTNACYFKASWLKTFDSSLTKVDKFYMYGGKIIKKKFMRLEDQEIPYYSEELFSSIKLYYKNDKFAFHIILPNEGKTLKDLLNKKNIDKIINSLNKYQAVEIDIAFPKFKFRKKYFLAKELQNFGAKEIFSRNANFTNMAYSNILYVSDVIHEAYIEVNEMGSEAAAATAIIIVGKGRLDSEKRIFKADKPFLFAITYDNLIIFLGAYCGEEEI